MRWRSCLGSDISDLRDVKNSEKGGFAPTGAGCRLGERGGRTHGKFVYPGDY